MSIFLSKEELQLQMSFFLIDSGRRGEMFEEYLSIVKELLGDQYFCCWSIGSKHEYVFHEKTFAKVLKQLCRNSNNWGRFFALSKSTCARNSQLIKPYFPFLRNRFEVCADDYFIDKYPILHNLYLDNVRKKDENILLKLKDASELFFLDGCRSYTCRDLSENIHGSYNIRSYENERYKRFLYGEFFISVNIGAQYFDLKNVAGFFKEKAQHFCSKFGNVNSVITLLPSQFCTMRQLFLNNTDSEITEMFDDMNIDPASFLLDNCGWWNHLSPLSAAIVRNSISPERLNADNRIESCGDAMDINASCGIEQLDIPELLKIKELMYPVMYPGRNLIHLNNIFPPDDSWDELLRPDGERIPVLHDEIEVDERGIWLTSRNIKERSLLKSRKIIEDYILRMTSVNNNWPRKGNEENDLKFIQHNM